MTELEQLKNQRKLLEQKKIDLDKLKTKTIHSQMNLRGGLMNRLQRQQDLGFKNIVIQQKQDTKKKILSISQLIANQETNGDPLISSASSSNDDFNILPMPTQRKVKRRGRIQNHMGFFFE